VLHVMFDSVGYGGCTPHDLFGNTADVDTGAAGDMNESKRIVRGLIDS
jgi:hypothetical protein